ncbi:hypothetical protein GCM10009798_08370 [Nocardioides panacihumi]|uniref:Uncharacterized protein n=2 Tax=Nocardioides panacihumi TaxID=400774 RepID=A0ABP5BS56_9ACTN
MTDGLEADLTELVAERGARALGSPVEYADELRAAAGLEVRVSGRPGRPGAPVGRAVGEAVDGLFDSVRRRAEGLLDRLPSDARPLLAWLRPLWWVARAWIALQVAVWSASAMFGIGYYEEYWDIVPHARGWGWVLLALLVAGSVLVGLGRLWPGGRRGALARTVLLLLNVLAVGLVPTTLAMVRNQSEVRDDAYSAGFDSGYRSGTAAAEPSETGIDHQAGIYSSGRWVTNIYPYDASGKPLVGVQLFDQLGKPISVVSAPECPDDVGGWTVNPVEQDTNCWDVKGTGETVQGRVPYPWTNGATQLENVFPLPTRLQDDLHRAADAFTQPDPPAIGELPLESVPPVSLPGVTPSVQAPPAKAAK